MDDHERLREHYRSLSTDELLDIDFSGNLTDMARLVLNAELASRGTNAADYAAAKAARTSIDADRESNTRRFLVRVWIWVSLSITMVVMALCSQFLSK